MDRLTSLPDKTLIDIVERVHADAPDALPTLGLTCRRLQRLCRPILWKGVVVPWRLNKNASISKFVVAHIGNEDIRSIRLCPQRAVLNAFKIKMKNAYDHVDALCTCLSSLPSLATFSIFLQGQIDQRCALPGPVLAQIVRALPPSLRNLELDTGSTDEIWDTVAAHHRHLTTGCTIPHCPGAKPYQHAADDSTTHLCHAISEHIPQLETLNLRLSCICTELFLSLSSEFSSNHTQPTSKLRRALVNFEGHGNPHVELRDCLSAPTGQPRFHSAGATTLEKQKIFKRLLDLQAAGAFPDLQRFIVFSWQTDAEFPTRYLNVRDVATRTVKKFPKLRQARAAAVWGDGLEEFWDESRYLLRSDGGGNCFGVRRRVESAVLHEVRWREEEGGVRIPPSTAALKDATVQLRVEELVDLEKVRDPVDFETVFPISGGFERARVVVERL